MAVASADRHVMVRFYNDAVIDQGRSDAEGRKIYRDMEMCEVRFPGDNTRTFVAPAHDPVFMHRPKFGDPDEGKGFLSCAERYADAYKAWKAKGESTVAGTPLAHAPFLTPAKVRELEALNVMTVEQLADLANPYIAKYHLRPMVEQAKVFLGKADEAAAVARANAERDALEARFAELERKLAEATAANANAGDEVSGWDDARLRAFIEEKSGQAPRANAARGKLEDAARAILADEAEYARIAAA